MSSAYVRRFTLLGQAAASPYADGIPESWGSGSTVTSSWSNLGGDLESQFGDLVEGGIVLDKRPCVDRDDFVRWIVSGPMRKADLPPRTCTRMLRDGEPCEDARTCGGFDYVSLDLYLDLWRSLGARIGTRQGNAIVWEDGTSSSIPKETERFPWQRKQSAGTPAER